MVCRNWSFSRGLLANHKRVHPTLFARQPSEFGMELILKNIGRNFYLAVFLLFYTREYFRSGNLLGKFQTSKGKAIRFLLIILKSFSIAMQKWTTGVTRTTDGCRSCPIRSRKSPGTTPCSSAAKRRAIWAWRTATSLKFH